MERKDCKKWHNCAHLTTFYQLSWCDKHETTKTSTATNGLWRYRYEFKTLGDHLRKTVFQRLNLQKTHQPTAARADGPQQLSC